MNILKYRFLTPSGLVKVLTFQHCNLSLMQVHPTVSDYCIGTGPSAGDC